MWEDFLHRLSILLVSLRLQVIRLHKMRCLLLSSLSCMLLIVVHLDGATPQQSLQFINICSHSTRTLRTWFIIIKDSAASTRRLKANGGIIPSYPPCRPWQVRIIDWSSSCSDWCHIRTPWTPHQTWWITCVVVRRSFSDFALSLVMRVIARACAWAWMALRLL